MQTNNDPTPHFIAPLTLATHEQYLFDLHAYPLIDIQTGLKNMNADQSLFINILSTLLTQEFPNEIIAYTQAHTQQDWGSIEKLAHKMKGGAIYTGLTKLQYACQYFEIYYLNDQSILLEHLYQQIMFVLHKTQEAISTLTAKIESER